MVERRKQREHEYKLKKGQAEPDEARQRKKAEEKDRILQALDQTGGNKRNAAKLLGIGKTTLYKKLKEHGIED